MKLFLTCKTKPQTWLLAIAVGLTLGALSALGTAGGHGTFIPISISGAPLNLFGFTAAIFGPLLLWPFLFWIAIKVSPNEVSKKSFIFVIALHYATGIFSIVHGPFANSISFARSEKAFPFLFIWFLFYLYANYLVWKLSTNGLPLRVLKIG